MTRDTKTDDGLRTGQVWRHRNGGHYLVSALARHTETGEELVVYCPTDGGQYWTRPRSMFLDGRFTRVR